MFAVLLLNRMRKRRQNLRKQKFKSRILSSNEHVPEYRRTCLGHEDLASIFYNKETAEKRTEDLYLVTGLKIKINDGLSQKICSNCMEIINQSLQFRLTSIQNDQKLRNTDHDYGFDATDNNMVIQYDYSRNNDLNSEYDLDNEFGDDCYLAIIDHDCSEDGTCQPDVEMPEQPPIKISIKEPNNVYKCQYCDKTYKRKVALQAYTHMHTNYTVCDECGKRCMNNSSLLQHKRARHGMERIHVCTYCDYTAASKTSLITHSRRHTGERPFLCAQCGSSFRSRPGLLQHLPIHLAESNFECDICHKREKSKRLLQHHQYKVHRAKRRSPRPDRRGRVGSPTAARLDAQHMEGGDLVDLAPAVGVEDEILSDEERVLEEMSIENYFIIE